MINFLIPYTVFLAYTVSYPVQVFTLGRVSGIFGYSLSALLLLLILQMAAGRQALTIKKRQAFVLALLALLPVAYLFSYLDNPSEYFAVALTKTAALYFLLCAITQTRLLALFSNKQQTLGYSPGLAGSWLLFGLPILLTLVATFRNSMGAIPSSVTLDSKYFYGPFIRAGGGYVDPNALGLMIILSLALMYPYISRYQSLLAFISAATLAIVILTFSRSAQVLFLAFAYFKLARRLSRKVFWFSLTVLIAVIAYLSVHDFNSVYLLFSRYFNDEGGSSVGDRENQIKIFGDMLLSANLKDLITGFGGQEAFQAVSGSAMHSAPLSVFIDAGIFPAVAILTFFAISASRAVRKPIDVFKIVAVGTSFVLPYIPELFFLLCMYLVVEDARGSLAV